jgi:hypothetical protein
MLSFRQQLSTLKVQTTLYSKYFKDLNELFLCGLSMNIQISIKTEDFNRYFILKALIIGLYINIIYEKNMLSKATLVRNVALFYSFANIFNVSLSI